MKRHLSLQFIIAAMVIVVVATRKTIKTIAYSQAQRKALHLLLVSIPAADRFPSGSTPRVHGTSGRGCLVIDRTNKQNMNLMGCRQAKFGTKPLLPAYTP